MFRPLAVCLGAFDFPPLVLRLDEHVVAAIYAEPTASQGTLKVILQNVSPITFSAADPSTAGTTAVTAEVMIATMAAIINA